LRYAKDNARQYSVKSFEHVLSFLIEMADFSTPPSADNSSDMAPQSLFEMPIAVPK
jgi:hypothetical protein